jgi:hypothetical protein
MASFTHVAQDVSPQYGRVTKITIRVCVTDCTGTRIYHRHAFAGRLHRDRLGRPCFRNKVDGGWINAGVYTLYRDNNKETG